MFKYLEAERGRPSFFIYSCIPEAYYFRIDLHNYSPLFPLLNFPHFAHLLDHVLAQYNYR